MGDLVFEYADGSGSWLVYSAGADPLSVAEIRKSCQREHARRIREGLNSAGVLRVRRDGERVCNERRRAEAAA